MAITWREDSAAAEPKPQWKGSRYSVEDNQNWKNLPEGENDRYHTTDLETGQQVTGTKFLNKFVPPPMPIPPPKPKTGMSRAAQFVGDVGSGFNRGLGNLAGIADIPLNIPFFGSPLQQSKPEGQSRTPFRNAIMDVLPTPQEPDGYGSQLTQAIMKQAPGAMIPFASQLNKGAKLAPLARSLTASAVGSGVGVGTARELAPGNVGAEIAGAILGGGVPAATSIALSKTPNLEKLIVYNLNKAIKPSTSGKNFMSDIAKYEDKGVGAVKQIVEDARSRNVPVPQTLDEFGNAIQSLKSKVFVQYNSLSSGASDAGLRVSLRPLVAELREVASDPVIQDSFPQVVNFANNQMQRYAQRGSYSPEEAERAIAALNSTLKAHYNGSTSGMTQAQANAMEGVATRLRQALDAAIEQYQGPGYQQLKNQYGQLRAIENDVVKRAGVHKRANKYGFFDLSDMFSAGKLVTGIAHMDPAAAAAGGTMLGVKRYLKSSNDPDKIIKTLFNKVDKYMPKQPTFAGPAERNIAFEQPLRPYEGEVMEPRSVVPSSRPWAPTVEGEFVETTPLPYTERAGLLNHPSNKTPLQVPWNPALNTGKTPTGMPINQGMSAGNLDYQGTIKSLIQSGVAPHEAADMVKQQYLQELQRRGIDPRQL